MTEQQSSALTQRLEHLEQEVRQCRRESLVEAGRKWGCGGAGGCVAPGLGAEGAGLALWMIIATRKHPRKTRVRAMILGACLVVPPVMIGVAVLVNALVQ